MAQRHGRGMQHQKGYSWFFLHMSSSWVTGLISTVLIVGTGGFFYAWYYQFSNDIAPDSVAGYVYAIAGTCCILLATVLYTIHRRSRKRLTGQLNAALNWHIFFAIMGIAFIFMHSFGNFNAKTGTYALYSLIALIISGFVGRALDRIMPWQIAREVDKILTAEGEDRVESISRNLLFQAETWYLHPRPTPEPLKTPTKVDRKGQPYYIRPPIIPPPIIGPPIGRACDAQLRNVYRPTPEPHKVDRKGQPYYIRPPIDSACDAQLRNVYSRVDPCDQPGITAMDFKLQARQLMVEIRKVEQALQREQFYRYVIHYWRILHVGLALLTAGLITWHLVYVGQLLMNAFMHYR